MDRIDLESLAAVLKNCTGDSVSFSQTPSGQMFLVPTDNTRDKPLPPREKPKPSLLESIAAEHANRPKPLDGQKSFAFDDQDDSEHFSPVHHAIAKRFNIPPAAVKSVMETHPDELAARDSYFPPSSGRSEAVGPTLDYPKHPLGTAKIDKSRHASGETDRAYVDYLREFDPQKLVASEHEDGMRNSGSVRSYVEWFKQGHQPPPISVFDVDNKPGVMQSTNRRRLLAAQMAGAKTITGWHGVANPETGSPLSYGDIMRAAKEYETQSFSRPDDIGPVEFSDSKERSPGRILPEPLPHEMTLSHFAKANNVKHESMAEARNAVDPIGSFVHAGEKVVGRAESSHQYTNPKTGKSYSFDVIKTQHQPKWMSQPQKTRYLLTSPGSDVPIAGVVYRNDMKKVVAMYNHEGKIGAIQHLLGHVYADHGDVSAAEPMSAQGARAIHRFNVAQAVRDGKRVPPEVLADYPDLQPQSFSRPDDIGPIEFSTLPRQPFRRLIDKKRTASDVRGKKHPTDNGDKGWTKVGGSSVHVDDEGVIDKGCPGLLGEAVKDLIDESDASRERREARQHHAYAAGITGDQLTPEQAKAMGSDAHVAAYRRDLAAAKAHPSPTVSATDVARGYDDDTGAPVDEVPPEQPSQPQQQQQPTQNNYDSSQQLDPKLRPYKFWKSASLSEVLGGVPPRPEWLPSKDPQYSEWRDEYETVRHAAAQYGVAMADILAAIPEAHTLMLQEAVERERAKSRARKLTGLTSGKQGIYENAYKDFSVVPRFDETSREFAAEHPEMGFDPDSHDTPQRVWEFIREGAESIPDSDSREVADFAAAMIAGRRRRYDMSGDTIPPFESDEPDVAVDDDGDASFDPSQWSRSQSASPLRFERANEDHYVNVRRRNQQMRLMRPGETPENSWHPSPDGWNDHSERWARKVYNRDHVHLVDIPLSALKVNEPEIAEDRQSRLDKIGGTDDPIIVDAYDFHKKSPDGRHVYNITDGNNRTHWAAKNGRTHVPAFVRFDEPHEIDEFRRAIELHGQPQQFSRSDSIRSLADSLGVPESAVESAIADMPGSRAESIRSLQRLAEHPSRRGVVRDSRGRVIGYVTRHGDRLQFRDADSRMKGTASRSGDRTTFRNPNGYINGTVQQFARPPHPHTQTPEFKAWHAGSQVVHPDGSPKVVYHGTGREFDTFKHGESGRGTTSDSKKAFYFTDNPGQANEYSWKQGDHIGIHMPVYLSAKNLYVADRKGQVYDPDIHNAAIDFAKKNGYDGVRFINALDPWGRKGDHFAVFHPNQIKSATGNSGQFSPHDDRITFSRDKEIGPVEFSLNKFQPSTPGAVVSHGYAGINEGFAIKTPHGAEVNGYTHNADFPGMPGDEKRGELFIVKVPQHMRRQGIGSSLAKDAIGLMKHRGAERVGIHATSKEGAALVSSLVRDGHIHGPIKTSQSGKAEYGIGESQSGDGGQQFSRPMSDIGPIEFSIQQNQSVDHESDYRENGHHAKSFKAWFGNWDTEPHNSSKVVHPETGEPHQTHPIAGTHSKVMRDGKPVAVYHGSPRGGFRAFDKSKLSDPESLLYGPGFYFTEDQGVADEYSGKRKFTIQHHPSRESAEQAVSQNGDAWRKRYARQYEDLQFHVKPTPGGDGDRAYHVEASGYEPGEVRLHRELNDADRPALARHFSKIADAYKQAGDDDNHHFYSGLARLSHGDAVGRVPGLQGTDLKKVSSFLTNPSSVLPYPTEHDRRHADDALQAIGNHRANDKRETKAVYLNIRNPFDMDGKTYVGDIAGLKRIFGDSVGGKIARSYGYTLGGNYGDWYVDNAIVHKAASELVGKSEANSLLQGLGYDGITHIGGHIMGDKKHRVWIAFEPHQIKAVNNRGTFDKDNHDIHFSRPMSDIGPVEFAQMQLPFDEEKSSRPQLTATAEGHHEIDLPESNTYPEFRARFIHRPDGKTDIVDTKDPSWRRGAIPTHMTERFLDEMHGVLNHPANSGHKTLDHVLSGGGTYLGKGHESMVHDAGNGVVVKSAVVTPYHWNHGIRQPHEANEIIDQSVAATKHLRSKGLLGILPQYGVHHDGRSFAVMPKVDTKSPLTEKHIQQLHRTIGDMHDAGYTLRDQVQAGLDHNGNAAIYDVGSVAKLSNEDRYKKEERDSDFENLRRLAEKHGVDYKTPKQKSYFDAYEKMLYDISKHTGMSPKEARAARARLHTYGKIVAEQDPLVHDFFSDSHANAEAKLRGWASQPVQMSRKPAAGQRSFEWDEDAHPRDELGQWTDKLHHQIKEYLSDGTRRHLRDVHSHTGHTKQDILNPLSNPTNAALKKLRDDGEINSSEPEYGEPMFYMTEEQLAKHRGNATAEKKAAKPIETVSVSDASEAKSKGVKRSKDAVEFTPAIQGPSGASLLSYDWKYMLIEEPNAKGDDIVVRRVSDWDESDHNEHTGRDIVHVFHVVDKDGKAHSTSLETAVKLLGLVQDTPGMTKVRNLAGAAIQLSQSRRELEKLIESGGKEHLIESAKERVSSLEERVKVLTKEAEMIASGKTPVSHYRETAHKLHSLLQLMKMNVDGRSSGSIGDFEPAGYDSFRQAQAKSREVANAIHRVLQMPNAIYTTKSPIPNKQVQGLYRGADEPWSDAKIRNWYLKNGEKAEQIAEEAGEFLKKNHPLYDRFVRNEIHNVLSDDKSNTITPDQFTASLNIDRRAADNTSAANSKYHASGRSLAYSYLTKAPDGKIVRIDGKDRVEVEYAKKHGYEKISEPIPPEAKDHKLETFLQINWKIVPKEILEKHKDILPKSAIQELQFSRHGDSTIKKHPWQMTRREFLDSEFNENDHRHLPSDYFDGSDFSHLTKGNYPTLVHATDSGHEIREGSGHYGGTWAAFHGDRAVGYADNKVTIVHPEHQRQGVGLAMFKLKKQADPNHVTGNHTPAGANLMSAYHADSVANAIASGLPVPRDVASEHERLQRLRRGESVDHDDTGPVEFARRPGFAPQDRQLADHESPFEPSEDTYHSFSDLPPVPDGHTRLVHHGGARPSDVIQNGFRYYGAISSNTRAYGPNDAIEWPEDHRFKGFPAVVMDVPHETHRHHNNPITATGVLPGRHVRGIVLPPQGHEFARKPSKDQMSFDFDSPVESHLDDQDAENNPNNKQDHLFTSEIPDEHKDEAAALSAKHGGGEVRRLKNGDWQLRSPKGGKVSEVNGVFYPGGQFMPIHGLSEKHAPKPKREKPTLFSPQQSDSRKEREPQSPMSPEQIEALRRERELDRLWADVQRTPLGYLMHLGDKPSFKPAVMTDLDLWRPFAEKIGPAAIAKLKDELEKTRHAQIDEAVKRYVESWEKTPVGSRRPSMDDADWEKGLIRDAAQQWQSFTPRLYKSHEKVVPGSHYVRELLAGLIEDRDKMSGMSYVERMKHYGDMLASLVPSPRVDAAEARQHGYFPNRYDGRTAAGKKVAAGDGWVKKNSHGQYETFTDDDVLQALGSVEMSRDGFGPVEFARHEFASTQFNLPDHVAKKVRELARKIPKEELSEDGAEDNPHITIKYGLHDGTPDCVRGAVSGFGPVKVKLGKTSVFEVDKPDGKYDVLKIEIAGRDIHRLNKVVADACEHTDTFPDYRPHVTVAYLKPGFGRKYAGDRTLDGTEMEFDSFLFSDKERNKTRVSLTGGSEHFSRDLSELGPIEFGWRDWFRRKKQEQQSQAPEQEPEQIEDRPWSDEIQVESSNVYSYAWEPQGDDNHGNLIVRFKNRDGGQGPAYRYVGTPKSVYDGMGAAESKGRFVWDNLRVRGTVSGHQYPYNLAGTGSTDYVPRQAIVARRGRVGEWYAPRTFNGQRSQLPEGPVRKSGDSPLPGYENRDKLQFKPSTPAAPATQQAPTAGKSILGKVSDWFRSKKPKQFSREDCRSMELAYNSLFGTNDSVAGG